VTPTLEKPLPRSMCRTRHGDPPSRSGAFHEIQSAFTLVALYVTGGTGFYDNNSFSRTPLDCANSYCIAGGKPFYFWQSHRTSIGLNGGVGVSFRLGGREFFVQQSAHVFDFRGSGAMFPVSVGIGF
jgi:hypothetical protein